MTEQTLRAGGAIDFKVLDQFPPSHEVILVTFRHQDLPDEFGVRDSEGQIELFPSYSQARAVARRRSA